MICGHSELEKDKLFEDIYYSQVERGKLYSATLELTQRCNLKCIHCYNPNHQKELSIDQLKYVIDKLVEMEALYLTITGGEPLLHKDFKEFWKYAYSKGLLLTLFTNGVLLDYDMVEFLKKYPPYSMEVSLYGFSDETYKVITKNAKAFQIVKTNIEKLIENKFHLYVKSVVMKDNYRDMEDIAGWLKKKNQTFYYDLNIIPTLAGDGKSHYSIGESEAKRLAEIVEASEDAEKEYIENVKKYQATHEDTRNIFGCGAGIAYLFVDAQGGVHPCVLTRLTGVSIFERSISEIMKDDFPKLLSRKTDTKNDQCRNCKDLYHCSWCPAVEVNSHVGEEVKDEWRIELCKNAKLTKEYFDERSKLYNL